MECLITLDSMNNRYGYSLDKVEVFDVTQSKLYNKWLEFAIDYCKKRNLKITTDVETLFRIYINSGNLTKEDVDEYNRLK